jgi:hypothetical protein
VLQKLVMKNNYVCPEGLKLITNKCGMVCTVLHLSGKRYGLGLLVGSSK